ncbi:hypothetical protein M5D96_005827, partial [Drosophila gunungcola]
MGSTKVCHFFGSKTEVAAPYATPLPPKTVEPQYIIWKRFA